jgi:regulator of nucleoside diphosphate kinase
MREDTSSRRMPKIIVSAADHERLTGLAIAAMERVPEVAEELLSEMDRAKVVAGKPVPPTVVQMGSTVEFHSDDGHHRSVTLVFPGEADIAKNKVSVLTPIGAALIGLSEGQSITWIARDGRRHKLTVLTVRPPSALSPAGETARTGSV